MAPPLSFAEQELTPSLGTWDFEARGIHKIFEPTILLPLQILYLFPRQARHQRPQHRTQVRARAGACIPLIL